MKYVRLAIQTVVMFLQTYFFVETIRLYFHGYVMYMGEPIETAWFSMLFTLLVVVVCEMASFADAILFIISRHNVYSFIYLGLIITNAFCFMTMAYYSEVGTTICISLYAVIFIVRIVNLTLNLISIVKKQ